MTKNKDKNTSKDIVQRDLTWDAIKGIAILLMVVGHSGCPSFLRNFIYLFHMGLFYYASGHFFKPCGIDGILPFLKKKIVGLYIPFLMWGAYMYCCIIPFTHLDGTQMHTVWGI